MEKRTRYRTTQAKKKTYPWSWTLVSLLALASLVACSPTATERTGTTGDQGAPKTTDPTLQVMIEHVQADLAQQLGVETGQITVLEAEAVEWRDSGLGCPQPGTMYAQVITPGYRIVLQVEDETHTYHTDQNRAVVLCDQ